MNECGTSLSVSLIWIRKRRGPITDLCGTPEITSACSDRLPLTLTSYITVWCLPVRNECSHLPIFPAIPNSLSLARVMLQATKFVAPGRDRDPLREPLFLSGSRFSKSRTSQTGATPSSREDQLSWLTPGFSGHDSRYGSRMTPGTTPGVVHDPSFPGGSFRESRFSHGSGFL